MSTTVFEIDNVSEEDAKKLEACHDKFINRDDIPELEWLDPWLEKNSGDGRQNISGDFRIIVTGCYV